jgi:hypothetical protein
LVRGLILEEHRDQVQGLIHKPQAIKHHRFDGFADGKVSHLRVLMGGVIDDLTNAKFIEHASDKAKVVQDFATVCGVIGHNNLL